jgi:Bacterial extracellular solute-binding proteins, family 3
MGRIKLAILVRTCATYIVIYSYMDTSRKLACLYVLLTLTHPFPFAAHTIAATKAEIATLDGIAPYSYYRDDAPQGILTGILKVILKELAIKPVFHKMNYSRAVASINNDTIDISPIFIINNSLAHPIATSQCTTHPLGSSYWGSHIKSKRSIQEQDKPLVMGSYQFLDYNFLRPFGISENVISFRSNELLFRSFFADRIDIAITDEGTAAYWSTKHKLDINFLENMGTTSIGICTSKSFLNEHPHFIQEFDQALLKLVNNETIDKMLHTLNLEWYISIFGKNRRTSLHQD